MDKRKTSELHKKIQINDLKVFVNILDYFHNALCTISR